MKGNPISYQKFKIFYQDLNSTKGDKSKLSTLTMLVQNYYFTCSMAKEIIQLFKPSNRKASLRLLSDKITDVHNGLLLYDLFEFDIDLQNIWKNWIFTGVWDSSYYE